MRKITPAQIRKIYATAKEYGLDSDIIHSVIYSETKKKHVKDMDMMEAVRVIDRITGKKQSTDPKREGMTFKQQAYIIGLTKDLGWVKDDGSVDEKRLNGFLSKFYGVDNYRWLTRSLATKAIEGLKQLVTKETMNT